MRIDGRSLDHKTLQHLRTAAVRRVVEDGEAPSAVMESMGLCRTSIYRWLRRYEDAGLEGPGRADCPRAGAKTQWQAATASQAVGGRQRSSAIWF